MKSLEHIIREIREGKSQKGSKVGLQSSIRKVMKGEEEESSFADRTTKPIDEKKKNVDEEEPRLHNEMNVNVSGHGKFTGSEFANIPVRGHMGHVTPHSHSDKAETAGMARKMAKEKLGKNRVAEETLDELAPVKDKEKSDFKLAPIAKEQEPMTIPIRDLKDIKLPTTLKDVEDVAAKGVEMVAKRTPIGKILEPSSTKELYPSEFARQQAFGVKPKPDVKSLSTTRPIELPSTKPVELPSTRPVELPKVSTPKKTETEVKPAETKNVETKTATALKPAETTSVATKTATATKGAQTTPPTPPSSTTPASEPEKIPKLAGAPTASTDIDYKVAHRVPVKTQIHFAKKHRMHEDTDGGVERKKIENTPRKDAGDRHNIEFVGRKSSEPKTSKEKTSIQAAYKINIIDEGKKLAGIVKGVVRDSKESKDRYDPGATDGKTIVYPQVIINPNLKHNTMDADSDKIPNDHK
jgi:hypothetical protein